MDLLVLLAVFAIIGAAAFIWWLVMLIDALRTPPATWDAARQNQVLYVVLMAALGIIGTIVYVVVASPQLRAVRAAS